MLYHYGVHFLILTPHRRNYTGDQDCYKLCGPIYIVVIPTASAYIQMYYAYPYLNTKQSHCVNLDISQNESIFSVSSC